MKVAERFKGYIFSDYYGTESYNLNIEERIKILDHLYKKKEFDEKILKNESCKTMYERYIDIKELFPTGLLENDVLPLFINWLIEKLVFIEILTQTSESAYTIFETMNDRGLNLTQTELLKSFLLSNVRDDDKIRELDLIWKTKISQINSVDNDQDFFKAWFRAKYAVTIRTTEKESENKDFEKIGSRFSSWTQENTKLKSGTDSKLLLDSHDPNSFYFFVKSDFSFFSDLYVLLKNLEINSKTPEHRFRFIFFKGISKSLSYPVVLSPLMKTDDEETISRKIELAIRYIDCYGVYRMLLDETINQSSIRNAMYIKAKEIRNMDIGGLIKIFEKEISEYRHRYLKMDFTVFNSDSKYILSRLYVNRHPNLDFESVYFLRRKESFNLYQFLRTEDFETEKLGLPGGLKDILVKSLCTFTMVPRQMIYELNALNFQKRLQRLLKEGLILEFDVNYDLRNMKEFFIMKEKKLKELISNLWKLP